MNVFIALKGSHYWFLFYFIIVFIRDLFPVMIHDELENLHADRTTNYMFWAMIEAEVEVGYPYNLF